MPTANPTKEAVKHCGNIITKMKLVTSETCDEHLHFLPIRNLWWCTNAEFFL